MEKHRAAFRPPSLIGLLWEILWPRAVLTLVLFLVLVVTVMWLIGPCLSEIGRDMDSIFQESPRS